MATQTGAKKKRPNPNDSTFRNINALKKRVAKLEDLMDQTMGFLCLEPRKARKLVR